MLGGQHDQRDPAVPSSDQERAHGERTSATHLGDLPDDVLANILARLPPLGFCALRCVSARWRALLAGAQVRDARRQLGREDRWIVVSCGSRCERSDSNGCSCASEGALLVADAQQGGDCAEGGAPRWLPLPPGMVRSISHCGLAVLHGELLLFGGVTNGGPAWKQPASAALFLWCPFRGRWRRGRDMRQARWDFAWGVWGAGGGAAQPPAKLVVARGLCDGRPPVSCEAYDPASGKWADLAPLPEPHYRMGSQDWSFVLGSSLHMVAPDPSTLRYTVVPLGGAEARTGTGGEAYGVFQELLELCEPRTIVVAEGRCFHLNTMTKGVDRATRTPHGVQLAEVGRHPPGELRALRGHRWVECLLCEGGELYTVLYNDHEPRVPFTGRGGGRKVSARLAIHRLGVGEALAVTAAAAELRRVVLWELEPTESQGPMQSCVALSF